MNGCVEAEALGVREEQGLGFLREACILDYRLR
jgi:hypothetical protein